MWAKPFSPDLDSLTLKKALSGQTSIKKIRMLTNPVPDPEIFREGRSILISGAKDTTGKIIDISIDNTGIISSIGDKASKKNPDPDIIIDGSDRLIIPGLINAHTHGAMTLLRGYADDMHLQQWLSEKIWPLEAHLTGDDVYWGTKLACLEMIRSGTVAFNDMYFYMEEAARAVDETGIRALLSHGLITFGDEEKFENEVKATKKLLSHIRGMNNPRIKAAVGPHAPYTVPPAHLSWCAEFSKEENIPLHIHLSETKQEVEDCKKTYGTSPAGVLDAAGCLTNRTIAAHGCWLDEADCSLLGEKGVHVVHNPVSNMKLATGRMMPYQMLKNAGVNVALATDGCSSNNNLDMFEEMKVAAIGQKFFWNQDTLLSADEAMTMATTAGAKALGFCGGVIAEGMPADLVLLDLSHPAMVPLHNPVSNLVYSAHGGLVQTVICAGKVLMDEGYIPWEEETIRKARETSISLVERSNQS